MSESHDELLEKLMAQEDESPEHFFLRHGYITRALLLTEAMRKERAAAVPVPLSVERAPTVRADDVAQLSEDDDVQVYADAGAAYTLRRAVMGAIVFVRDDEMREIIRRLRCIADDAEKALSELPQ